MRGIILAAGKGSRLNGTAGDKPKCLVRVGDRTLLERQIDTLRAAGIGDIAVVVGCQAESVRLQCGGGITYIENSRFAQTNSLYSLWLARPLLDEGFVVMNCDVLFHPQLLTDLVTSRYADALLIAYQEDDSEPLGDEEMKIKVRRGRVVDMSKTMPADEADGENLGILKFGPEGALILSDILDERIAAGALRDWAPRAFADFARIRPLHAIGTRGLPWTEIDFPEDYQRAVNEILPLIEADELALMPAANE
ncbi:MAG TPA: phosphocholine cytidylyltransferase family protein [Vicinamibacterales bacterium]|nr:phosphocholine cytidylyltransferase family protein [Vicinamibacterales bacterium]